MNNGTREKLSRKKTPRDVQMSKLMKQIKAVNTSLAQYQVLSMASKQRSHKKTAAGLYLKPYPKDRGR